MPGSGVFQSLTRDSNHSNRTCPRRRDLLRCFNPSRGIAIIQTGWGGDAPAGSNRFNPSRGIAIIQTAVAAWRAGDLDGFNPSRGIAIIQTATRSSASRGDLSFQSLTRDSNHSNRTLEFDKNALTPCFNPSRGIAIIQTRWLRHGRGRHRSFNPSRGIAIIQT